MAGKDEGPSLPACIPPGTSPYYRSHLRAMICKAFPPGVRDKRFSPPDRQTLSKVKNLVLGLE